MKARNVERTVPVIAVDLLVHGTFSSTAPGLDLAMERYHGCTARELAALVTERVGIDFHDVEARSSLLIVLAELDGHAGDLAPRVRAQVVQTGLFA